MVEWINYLPYNSGVMGLISDFSSLLDETLRRGCIHMTFAVGMTLNKQISSSTLKDGLFVKVRSLYCSISN